MKKQWKGFLAGLVTAALLGALVTPVLGALAGKTIQVYIGVDVYVDDVKVEPTDVNGNPVEVFVYNGTTYLPIRAIGKALGKPVQWEGKTNSAYVGKHRGEKPAVWVKDLDCFSKNGTGLRILESDSDNLGVSYQDSMTLDDYYMFGRSTTYTYVVNGQYSAVSGVFYHRKAFRNEARTSTLKIFGDSECIYSATVDNETKPIDFYVDTTGVLELKVTLSGDCIDYGVAAIAEFGLWT